ncbi:MAG: hypothetical protein ABUL64_02815, partial [Singulisphaera sp.]
AVLGGFALVVVANAACYNPGCVRHGILRDTEMLLTANGIGPLKQVAAVCLSTATGTYFGWRIHTSKKLADNP